MAKMIVEHKWSQENSEEVFKVVGSIVEMSKDGQLPDGYRVKSIDLLDGQNRAICTWEAPSREALSGLIEKVNPPTSHSISEAKQIL